MSDPLYKVTTQSGTLESVEALGEAFVPSMTAPVLMMESLRRMEEEGMAIFDPVNLRVVIVQADQVSALRAALAGLPAVAEFEPVTTLERTSPYLQTVPGAPAELSEIVAPQVPVFTAQRMLSKVLGAGTGAWVVIDQRDVVISARSGTAPQEDAVLAAIAALTPQPVAIFGLVP